MNLIKDNREIIVVSLVVLGLAIMAAAIGFNFRGGNPWSF
jgi:hypothetical protein